MYRALRRVGVLTLVLWLFAAIGTRLPMAAADENYPTIDGLFSGDGPIGSDFPERQVLVTGRGGVPATGVGAVVLNVTVTNASAPSFLTVWPTGQPRPTASNLNFGPGDTRPNAIVVKVGDRGLVSVYNNSGTVDVIVDVQGWFPQGAAFTALNPARVMDTRVGHPTIDGNLTGIGAIQNQGVLDLALGGRGGVPASGVGAVVLNVTVTNVTAPSFMTVWPTGTPGPFAANLYYAPGGTFQNLAIAKLGDGGKVSLSNVAGTADVVVDVLGWFPESNTYSGLTPARLMSTLASYPTIDGSFRGGGPIQQNSTANLAVLGRGGIPVSGVGAVALNISAANPTMQGFLTVWPTGAARPTSSNLNVMPGQTISNMVIATVGADGQVSLYNSAGTVDVIVDVMGWFPTDSSYNGLTPARLMDTRSTPRPPLLASWRLADGFRPTTRTRQLPLLVLERGCAGGRAADGRIEPAVGYHSGVVQVTVGVVPLPGLQACPSNPETPYTLVLDAPLGNRSLVDADGDVVWSPAR